MKIVVTKENSLQYEATVLDDDLINGGELFIGRDDDCHVILDSQMVSRHHAKIKYEDRQLHIESLSNFGVIKVDGREGTSAIIQNGSKVEINEFVIHFDQFSPITAEPEISAPDEYESSITEPMAPPIGVDIGVEDDNFEDNLTPNMSDDFDDDLGGELGGELDDDLDDDYGDELGGEPLGVEAEDSNLGDELGEDNFADELEGAEPLDYADEDTLADDASDENLAQADQAFDGETEHFDDENEGDSDFAGGFGDDDDFAGGDDFGAEGDMGGDEKTQVLTSFATFSLKIFGEFAPFDTYKLDEAETKIGRDETQCQIVLNDPEVSKVHAIIKRNIVNVTIEDNNSSNGIILNGERINKADLTAGDEFIIGETTFTVTISSDILESERGRLMPVEENQEVIIEDEVAEDIDFNEGEAEGLNFDETALVEEKSLFKKIMKDPKKKRIAIVAFVVLGALMLIEEPKPEKKDVPDEKKKVVKKEDPNKPQYSPEKLQILEQNYNLALSKFEDGQYHEAKEYIDIVKKIDPNYKLTPSLDKSIQESLDLILRKKEEEELRKEQLAKLKRIKELVDKAKEAVKERKVQAANSFFTSIYELDPENIDVPPLKIEIDAYVEEQERKKQEKLLAEAKRKAMVDKLAPGKAEYLKGEWYKAIALLQKFVEDKTIDEDLLKEGTQMLNESQKKLIEYVEPLLSKARSFKEGQDLKMAYETYGEVLKYDPANEEALNERENIFESLTRRSKRIYREALIKEDLSDFARAKEKFQEVQQVSPINSEYYNKATEKLKNYLE